MNLKEWQVDVSQGVFSMALKPSKYVRGGSKISTLRPENIGDMCCQESIQLKAGPVPQLELEL